MNLVNINTSEIVELLKSAYYQQYGEQIQIGSDEFAASSAQAYAWSVLIANVNEAAKNLFVETATREYLIAIAAQYGIPENVEYRAMAYFSITYNHVDHEYAPGEIRVSDSNGHMFTNIHPISSPFATVYDSVVLYAEEMGAAYNDIPANSISISQSPAVVAATNLTPSRGGLDGFPDTPEGTEEYRAYVKNAIKSHAGAGTAEAYEAKARTSTCLPIQVRVLRQGETGYEKGKVKIYVYTTDGIAAREVIDCAKWACSDPAFRPIGDLVEVKESLSSTVHLSLEFCVTYPSRFSEVAQTRTDSIIAAYLEELRWNMDMPFKLDELCHRLCAVDTDGVFATDAYAVDADASDYPIIPAPGWRLDISGITSTIQYKD